MHICEMMFKDVLCPVKEGGKLVVLGSCHMFSDQYIDKEENSKILVSPVGIYCYLFWSTHTSEVSVSVFCSPVEFVSIQSLLLSSVPGCCAPVAHG